MKHLHFYSIFLALVYYIPAFSQQDTLTRLEEVLISDFRLHKNSEAQAVTVLRDSSLLNNEPSLTSLLKYNTPIYFRENGHGMVSSPSFRGTAASQTAVVWNGININSQFTGQTDFNTISTTGYDYVAVRAGGGSVLYGSGAIGGSVHLNNKFQFDGTFRNKLRVEYGSFNTRTGRYSAEVSSEKTSLYVNIAGTASDNDFEFPGTNQRNRNGDYFNTNLNAGFAHWLNNRNILKFYSEHFSGERALSATLTATSQSKYEDVNSRNLLEWKHLQNSWNSSLKLGYLDEHYKYYENRNREDFSFGQAKTYLTQYDISYRLNSNITINSILDYRNTRGVGSNVMENIRETTSFAFLFNHRLGEFFYELSTRKEFTDNFTSPVLFSLNAGYAVTSYYDLSLNFSRNFRIPTFNDLFWRAGGNQDLSPEDSYQAELGQDLHFNNWNIGVTGFLIEISDLLRWVPDATGLWRPQNTQSVRNYGLEVRGEFHQSFGAHKLELNSGYAYTRSWDKILKRELIYVPRHKATGSLGYSHGRYSMFYQFLYHGSIFTSSDNKYRLGGYGLSNLGIAWSPAIINNFKVGFELRNLFNKKYQSLPSRPMPGRSINSSITINF